MILESKRSALLFDLDGTLMDTRADLCAAVNRMRADYGLAPLPVETTASFVGDGIRKLVERSLRGHPAPLDEAVARCAAHYRAHLHDHTTLYPGVREGLRRLRQAGHPLALVTNKPAEPTRALLEHFHLADEFALVLGGGDTPHLKPHPEPLRLAIERLGAEPSSSWMIGDHRTDLEAARHAGIQRIFVTYGIGRAEPEHPERTAASFDEVTALLLAQTEASTNQE